MSARQYPGTTSELRGVRGTVLRAQRRILGIYKTNDLCAIAIGSWASDGKHNEKAPYYGQHWERQIPPLFKGFLGDRIPYHEANFGGSPRSIARYKTTDSDPAGIRRDYPTSGTAVPTLPSRAHPQDYGSRPNSLKLTLVLIFVSILALMLVLILVFILVELLVFWF